MNLPQELHWITKCTQYTEEEKLIRSQNQEELQTLELFPLIDQQYDHTDLDSRHKQWTVDTISRLDFTNTVYDYFEDNLFIMSLEKVIAAVDYLVDVRQFSSFPFLFRGLLNRSLHGYGRGGNEINYLISLGYGHTDQKAQQLSLKLRYIMKRTDYHIYRQPVCLFHILHKYEYHLQSDSGFQDVHECYKFLHSYNEAHTRQHKSTKTSYFVPTLYEEPEFCECIYYSRYTTRELNEYRNKFRDNFCRTCATVSTSTDILRFIFDLLVPKVIVK